MTWFLSLAVVFCNIAAQVSIKLANQPSHTLIEGWGTWASPWIISAIFLHGVSFILTVRIFALLPLLLAAPTMAGATFFLVALASTSC